MSGQQRTNRVAIEDMIKQIEGQAPAAVRYLMASVVELSNFADPVDLGKHRGSKRVSLNTWSGEESTDKAFYPTLGAAEVDAALAPMTARDDARLEYIAEHSSILALGRGPDSNGRMRGSLQSPDGRFLENAIDDSRAKLIGATYDGENYR